MKSLTHPVNLRIALLAAIALLIAQFGAQAHAYSHLHAGAAHGAQQMDFHTAQCFDCLSFAPLLAGAGTPAQLLPVAPQGVVAAPDAAIPTRTAVAPAHGFRSRAPPSTH